MTTTATAPTFPSSTALGFYDFEEGDAGTIAADTSGNGNDGVKINAPVTVAGKINSRALLLSSSAEQYVHLPLVSPAAATEAETRVLWIRTTNRAAEFQSLVAFGSTATSRSAELRLSNGFLQFFMNTAPLPVFINVPDRVVTDGQWHHVGMTRNRSEVMMYVDGRAYGSLVVSFGFSAVMSLFANLDSVDIGATVHAGAGIDFFDGEIDNVQLFTSALSPQAVKALCKLLLLLCMFMLVLKIILNL